MVRKPKYCWQAAAYFSALEEEWRLGRLCDDDAVASALKTLLKRSRRVGASGGKFTRTFHLSIRPFKASPKPRRANRQ